MFRRGSSGLLCASVLDLLESPAGVSQFFNKAGQILAYLCLIMYTLGTLCVYAVTVASSLSTFRSTMFGFRSYYVILTVFAVVVLPFCFGNFQNTKYLQMVVIVVRLVFFLAIIFSSSYLMDKEPDAPIPLDDINLASVGGLPWMFGNAIFTFMIHHSVPGLLSPVDPSANATKAVAIGYTVALALYLLMCSIAMFTFQGSAFEVGVLVASCRSLLSHILWPITLVLQELYNDNFATLANYNMKWMSDFLDAYPVLMVALYPLITITLRNNLQAFVSQFQADTVARREATRERRASLASSGGRGRSRSRTMSNPKLMLESPVHRVLLDTIKGEIDDTMDDDEDVDDGGAFSGVVYTLCAALPPLAVAYCTDQVQVCRTQLLLPVRHNTSRMRACMAGCVHCHGCLRWAGCNVCDSKFLGALCAARGEAHGRISHGFTQHQPRA